MENNNRMRVTNRIRKRVIGREPILETYQSK